MASCVKNSECDGIAKWSLKPLETFVNFQDDTFCDCYECEHEFMSTFHLAYFLHFGLKFPEDSRYPDRLLIDESVIAQAYAIYEERSRQCNRVFSLTEQAAMKIVENFSGKLQEIKLPSSVLNDLDRCEGAFDVIDNCMSRIPGNTIFRPFAFPRFLFMHDQHAIARIN